VQALPSTLNSLDRALASTRALAEPLRPALDRLAPVVDTLPNTLAAARTATPAFSTLVAKFGALERAGAGPLRRLAAIAPQLAPTARALRGPTARVTPIVSAVDAHRDGIGQLGERFSGVLSTNDANGTILRGLGTFEPFDPANVGESGSTQAQRAAAAAKAVEALEGACLEGGGVACLARYLIPGLPGGVR
jgi:ABC-type transporter Mla subunit MlaD